MGVVVDMPAYFGSGGQLFEVKCPASADRVSSRPVAFTRTLGGKVKAFAGQSSRRSWSLNVEAGTPQDVSTVEALARTLGPLVFISPEAAVGNLLSPQASAFEPIPANATDAGLVQLPDGTVAKTVASTMAVRAGNANGNSEYVPVRPGEPVSVGAWGLGGARFQGFWRDATGANIGSYLSPVDSHAGWQWRSFTTTPPAGASYIELQLIGGVQYALPSVSWGDTAARELGTGCPKAVLHDGEFSPIAAHRRLNRSRIAYSVTEVG